MIEEIKNKMMLARFSPEERAVAHMLSETPVTQREIARSEEWIGTHPVHESYDAETTTRMVREIIRTLRVTHGIPILSGHDGYFLPTQIEQVKDFLLHMEREVNARNKASIDTYQALKTSCRGIASKYFERLDSMAEHARQAQLF